MDARELAVDELATMEVDLGGPVDLEKTLECGQAFRWRKALFPGRSDLPVAYSGIIPVARISDPALDRLACPGRERQLSAIVGQTGPVTDRVSVAYEAVSPDALSYEEVELAILRYFSAEDDVVSFERELSAKDPVLAAAVERAHGLRVLRQDAWECLASYILSTNNNITNISRTIERLADCLGEPAGLGRNGFPAPDKVAEVDWGSLRVSGCGFRDRYLWEAARRVSSGEMDLDILKGLSTEEARKELMKVSGVGPKVADCVLLFAYHRLEVFPVDVWVARAVSRHYAGGRQVTPRSAGEEGRRRFGRLAGYAQEYLFYQARRA